MNVYQLKLEVHDTYKKDEKITTSFEPSNDEDVTDKTYLDKKLFKIDGNLPFIEKTCKKFNLYYNKQSVEEALIQRNVKTTIPILYDKGLFDSFPDVDNVLKILCLLQEEQPIKRN